MITALQARALNLLDHTFEPRPEPEVESQTCICTAEGWLSRGFRRAQ